MSGYGNVPVEDVDAVRQAAAVAVRLHGELPLGAPSGWADVAFETVLESLLRDWVMNGTTELDPDDVEDLRNLVRLAADTALSMDPPLRDAAFRCLVRGVMADWVDNWNEGDDEE